MEQPCLLQILALGSKDLDSYANVGFLIQRQF